MTEYAGHVIEFETYSGSFFAYACSLFVDNKKVDSTEYGVLFSYFSLRHNLISDGNELRIKVVVRHTFHTSAKLFVNDEEIPFKRII